MVDQNWKIVKIEKKLCNNIIIIFGMETSLQKQKSYSTDNLAFLLQGGSLWGGVSK